MGPPKEEGNATHTRNTTTETVAQAQEYGAGNAVTAWNRVETNRDPASL
jgi:hypothetical protein